MECLPVDYHMTAYGSESATKASTIFDLMAATSQLWCIGPMSWLSSDKMIVDVKRIWKTLWLRNSDGSISLIAESGDVEVYLKDWKIESNRRVDDGTCIMMNKETTSLAGLTACQADHYYPP